MTEFVSVVRGVGGHLPERVLTNDDLAKMVDTTDEWITARTGIKKRHIAADGETTSDLGAIAAKKAMDAAGVGPEDIDLIVMATEGRHGVGHARGDDVVGHQVAEPVEPPQRHRGEDAALVRDGRGQHPVVRRDPVAGHEQQPALGGLVEVADLARVDVREPLRELVLGGRDLLRCCAAHVADPIRRGAAGARCAGAVGHQRHALKN